MQIVTLLFSLWNQLNSLSPGTNNLGRNLCARQETVVKQTDLGTALGICSLVRQCGEMQVIAREDGV